MKRPEGIRRSLATGLMVMIGLAAATAAASAQNAQQIDVAAGYQNVQWSMHGWSVELSVPTTHRWSLIGELNGSNGPDCRGCNPTYHDLAYLGGVRFGWHPTARVSPFWQVLAGRLQSKADGYYYDSYKDGFILRPDGPVQVYREGYSGNYFDVQPGGGVTVMVTPRFGIRAQADLEIGIVADESLGASLFPRVAVGGVVRLGR